MSEATRLLAALGEGDAQAATELLPLVYDALRQMARSHMATERAGHTLQATALVHEAYLRLMGADLSNQKWEGRRHFFAAAAEAMRRILIEHARRKQSMKRGGAFDRVAIDEHLPVIVCPATEVADLLTLDDALQRLTGEDPALAELVKLAFFTGLSLEEAAAALGISRATAYRQWAFARAWLFDAMGGDAAAGNGTAR